MTRVLIAPCSFKGALSSSAAAAAMGEGARAAGAVVVLRPIADGGEGTLDVLMNALAGTCVDVDVPGPLGDPVRARLGLAHDGKTAIVETAQAAGLGLVAAARRDPLRATTKGVGALIRAALDRGAARVLVTLGGSGTVDGGAGMMHALGARFHGDDGAELAPTPDALRRCARVALDGVDERLRAVELIGLCDVATALAGARLYMPQKGASPADCDVLEDVLRRLHGDDARTRDAPGTGAAGGLGAGLAALGGVLVGGAGFVMAACGLAAAMDDVDLVVTGEGALDAQTSEGKAIQALAELALRRSVPLVALAGRVDDVGPPGVVAAFAIGRGPALLQDAVARTGDDLRRSTESVVRLFDAARAKRPAPDA